MDFGEIVRQVEQGQVVTITRDDLGILLERAESVREDATSIAGRIRTLFLGDRILVQDRTPEGHLFVREVCSKGEAERFVESRLAAYERMWDG